MKIRVLLSIIALIWSLPAAAQTVFAPAGAEWTYQYFGIGAGGFSGRGAVRYAATRDTLVQGRVCRLLEGRISTYDAAVPNSPVSTGVFPNQLVAVDGDRILYFHQATSTFYTWVDFSAQPGASWPVRAATPCFGSGAGVLDTAVVDSVGTMQISGQTLRWVKLRPAAFANSFASGLYQYGRGRIIERIGHELNLVPGGYCGTDPDIADGLACYHDASGFGYSSFSLPTQNCAAVLLGEQSSPALAASADFVPNPSADGRFYIEGNAAVVPYVIVDVQGRQVCVGQLTTAATEIDLTDLSAGIYLLRGVVAGQRFTRRLIKQ